MCADRHKLHVILHTGRLVCTNASQYQWIPLELIESCRSWFSFYPRVYSQAKLQLCCKRKQQRSTAQKTIRTMNSIQFSLASESSKPFFVPVRRLLWLVSLLLWDQEHSDTCWINCASKPFISTKKEWLLNKCLKKRSSRRGTLELICLFDSLLISTDYVTLTRMCFFPNEGVGVISRIFSMLGYVTFSVS